MALIFVDCEDVDPVAGTMREFGAVEFKNRTTFHGKDDSYETFVDFAAWLQKFKGRPIFVPESGCWEWQGTRLPRGYGCKKHDFGRREVARRHQERGTL